MKNKSVILVLVAMLTLSLTGRSQVSFGHPERINNDWKFILEDVKGAEQSTFNDEKWRAVDLPHDWSVSRQMSPALASSTGFLPGGIGWYRKHLTLPVEKKERRFYLYFEGVYNHSEVFVNGHSLGMRPNGYISFMYDATPWLKFGEENVIAVRVDHTIDDDSRWYTGSGIDRDVWLIEAGEIHIDQWGVFYQTPEVSTKEATVAVQVAIANVSQQPATIKVQMTLKDKDGKKVASSSSSVKSIASGVTPSSFKMKVSHPELWSPASPYLYRLTTELYQGKKLIDSSSQALGIRTMTYDANKGFALNGVPMKMKGVCLHEDAGVLGNAVPREVWKRKLKTLKEIGCNAIRMSHNPHAPALYDLCDEMGFLTIDEGYDEWELPKKKWIEGWNQGTPGLNGTSSYFKEWYEADLKDLILRDRNHPSIVMWSIGNEIDYPNDPYSHPVMETGKINQPVQGAYVQERPHAERLGVIAKQLAAVVKKYDTTRPVTAALAGVIMSNETEYPGALDVVGYNYTENRYAEDHKKYPNRILYGSENGHSFDAWTAVRDNEYIIGQFLWTGIDYLGEARAYPSRGSSAGLLDIAGFRKPNSYMRASLWSDKPMCYLGTYSMERSFMRGSREGGSPLWNYEAGQKVRVVCNTNCAETKLLLNGKQVGEIQKLDKTKESISWEVPYEAGKLEVVGMNEGKEVCRYAIQTAGRPAAINVSVESEPGDEVQQIAVQIVDEQGVPVLLADDEVTCLVEGSARVLGMESGDMNTTDNLRDRSQRVYKGRLLAYVRNQSGERTIVRFTAPWLKAAEVVIGK